jgi:ATP-dependent DNA helicase RecG
VPAAARRILPVAFAEAVPAASWPRPRGFARPERLDAGLDVLPGVGGRLRPRLAKLGLRTVRDALETRPHRYEVAAPERRICDLLGDEEAVVAGVVRSVASRRRGRLLILTAHVADATGDIRATWFNQPWLAEQLQPGTRVRLRGRITRHGFNVVSHDIGEDVAATADFAPVYPASEETPAKTVRRVVEAALAHAGDEPDPLPAALRATECLPRRADALHAVHRPRSLEEAERGRARLAFEELLVLQAGLARRRLDRAVEEAYPLGQPGELVARYRAGLPFALTPSQETAVAELDADLARPVPMQRLLQGDVGSGKTVVALYALLRAVDEGFQGALMAPTETLAEQHFLTLDQHCRDLGVPAVLLTSSLPARDHQAARDRIASGEARIAVGTHALIQRDVSFARLAVAVVDEQHRFGVEQRKALAVGRSPHVLHMTATPIPRTLALTVYGDLAVSEIAKPPATRKPVMTAWVTADRSSEAYQRLRRHLEEGRQAYVVCPLIEAGETSLARAAEDEAERLRAAELRGLRVGCLHGRLKPAERRDLMARFKAREIDVLVATTVIEVGVDVPNATIMIVQEADRFGLAQLHQLRGRVGRGAEQSYCLLVSRPLDQLTETAVARLEALVRTTDGFELAEVDLELRGGGQLLGTRQSGATDLRFTRLRDDRPLLERARVVAEALAESPAAAPGTPLAAAVERAFRGHEDPGA